MALWQVWTDLLQGVLQTLGVDWRLGGGLAIIILPQLKLIREAGAKDPQAQMQRTIELYRQHGLKTLALRRVLAARAGGSLA
jgi:hypothetical protein